MNRLNYVCNEEEVEVLVRDENGIGLGSARLSQNDVSNYTSETYQNRLNLTLSNDEELLEDLAVGKAYIGDNTTLLEAVNSVLDFWFVAPTTEDKIKEVPEFKSLTEALSYFSTTNEKYLICSILYK